MSFPLQEVLQLDREIVEKNHPPDQSESEGQMDLQAAYLIDHIYIYMVVMFSILKLHLYNPSLVVFCIMVNSDLVFICHQKMP